MLSNIVLNVGEPSPYVKDSWSNHSSMFGIIDLASIPKDRFWLYRSQWNRNKETLHIFLHWNWKGHEGEKVPVFVYTSWPEAEIFVNGKSYGRKRKEPSAGYPVRGLQNENVEGRYRLMWDDVVYAPGELKVVAYDENGESVDERTVRTAGNPHHVELSISYPENPDSPATLTADGKSLLYVTARVVDKDGNICPHDSSLMSFKVSGAASYRASANGDPTCLDIFHEPQMHAFNGCLTIIVQSSAQPGEALLDVRAKGLRPASMNITVSR